jgi:cytochrome c biogenesis protein CcdA/thiol-disulfide isomerase/thioredoxin
MLFVLAFLGGVLTIVSPCILPVVPFVFTSAGRPFARSGLPLLAGMVLAFAAVATVAAVGGGWVVRANIYARWLALALVAAFGVMLLLPTLATRVAAPLVSWGNRMSGPADRGAPRSFLLLGIATGMLWAPCAGPILGLVLTGAALNGASTETSLLLAFYAAGAAVSLAAALAVGGRALAALTRTLGAGEWLRRAAGVAVVVAAGAIALGLDTGALARLSTASTTRLEQALSDALLPDRGGAVPTEASTVMMAGGAMMSGGAAEGAALPVEGPAPALDGATEWVNSEPLTLETLRGKVVLYDFWTYSCINCLRALPYVNAWADKYRDAGLVVVGIHSPEFAFEKDLRNVRRAIADLQIDYPVAVDNDYELWRAFANRYWPAHYFADATGQIRYRHFGEGDYEASEAVIRRLLAEAGLGSGEASFVAPRADGAALTADWSTMQSPETYIGYERAERFSSDGGQVLGVAHVYSAPAELVTNAWALDGEWIVAREHATLAGAAGRIVFRFHARDLHLVLGPATDGTPVEFRLRIDGVAPAGDHGADVSAAGDGVVTEERLYQLIRQSGPVRARSFEIEFSRPGVRAYAFTFG